MKKFLKRVLTLACLIGFLTFPYFVFATNTVLNNLKDVGERAGGYASASQDTSLATIAGSIVSGILSLLGIIFIVLIIYAGITWMTAEGDENKVEKAQTTLRNAIIGLVITISVYAIYQLVNLYLFQSQKIVN